MHRLKLGLASLFLLAACNGAITTIGNTPDGGGGGGGGNDPSNPTNEVNPVATGAATASKVDLLFVVDNSAGMRSKQKLLSKSIAPLIARVSKTNDVHIGVITTSLGTPGGDICPASVSQQAHLATTDSTGTVISNGVLTLAEGPNLLERTQALIEGVGENGCGLEAQLESAYRFLVAPDPWSSVVVINGQAAYSGNDLDLLLDRKRFLRPDSLVLVVLLTDEDDSLADPLSISGQGWAFSSYSFPGSQTFRANDPKAGTTAPKATTACATGVPSDPACTSCGFASTCDKTKDYCVALNADANCKDNGGYYGATDDDLNVRFHRMKQRYGVDPQYPIARYIDGFSRVKTPERASEHKPNPPVGTPVDSAQDVSNYIGSANVKCTNPLFASSLPGGQGDELCNLPRGPRGRELVMFTVIGGVPEVLTGGGYDAMIGRDPTSFDESGIDAHMVQSTSPRLNVESGFDHDTKNTDLEDACRFTLEAPVDCSTGGPQCVCNTTTSNPLCEGQVQVRDRAVPSIRPITLAKGLGESGLVGSICPTDTSLGYASTINRLIARIDAKIPR